MNKIFKVIWSKSKQCYVVVSEMAKNTTGKKKIVVASILAGLATQGCSVMAAPVPQGNNSWGGNDTWWGCYWSEFCGFWCVGSRSGYWHY